MARWLYGWEKMRNFFFCCLTDVHDGRHTKVHNRKPLDQPEANESSAFGFFGFSFALPLPPLHHPFPPFLQRQEVPDDWYSAIERKNISTSGLGSVGRMAPGEKAGLRVTTSALPDTNSIEYFMTEGDIIMLGTRVVTNPPVPDRSMRGGGE